MKKIGSGEIKKVKKFNRMSEKQAIEAFLSYGGQGYVDGSCCLLFRKKEGWYHITHYNSTVKSIEKFLKTIIDEGAVRIGIGCVKGGQIESSGILQSLGFNKCEVEKCEKVSGLRVSEELSHWIWNLLRNEN